MSNCKICGKAPARNKEEETCEPCGEAVERVITARDKRLVLDKLRLSDVTRTAASISPNEARLVLMLLEGEAEKTHPDDSPGERAMRIADDIDRDLSKAFGSPNNIRSRGCPWTRGKKKA